MKNQIIGLVRFSYPAKNGFQKTYPSLIEEHEALYAAERMALRFDLFKRLCLTSLANQTDKDFTLVVLIGEDIPPVYFERLQGLLAPFDWAVLVAQPRRWIIEATKRAFAQVTDPDATYVTTFRIDDDDAVAVDYIAQTRARVDQMIAANMLTEPTVLAFTSGIYWDTAKARNGFHLIKKSSPLGLACALVTPKGESTNVFRWNHRKFARYFQTVLAPTEAMFIRTLHSDNDSGKKLGQLREACTPDEIVNILRARFKLELAQLAPDPAAP